MSLKDKFVELVNAAKKEKGAIKLPLNQQWKAFQLYLNGVVLAIEESDAIQAISSPEKKEAALKAAALFYESYIVSFDLPYVPNLIEPIVDRYIKTVFLLLASGAIDATVATLKQFGVIKSKGVI